MTDQEKKDIDADAAAPAPSPRGDGAGAAEGPPNRMRQRLRPPGARGFAPRRRGGTPGAAPNFPRGLAVGRTALYVPSHSPMGF